MFGSTTDTKDRLKRLREQAQKLGGIIILKGPKTAIAFPDGQICFNTSGNPGMATAGSGDVLTGLILGFLSQGYSPEDSSKLAVFIHGYAGDLASIKYSELSMIASDIIEMIPQTFLWLQKKI
jgi:NAD(P)H-hydrate epimerase